MDLVVMAAGLGSRFGGLKQLAQVGPSGETVMDYAVYDAVRAGLDRVVFVIRHDFEAEFHERIGSRYEGWLDVAYAFQDLADLPGDRQPPTDRTKPWGTAHAVWAARDVLRDAPFVVVNADDFYGRAGFEALATFLGSGSDTDYALVAYELQRTLSENGPVSRGVCEVDDAGRLVTVTEHHGLQRAGDEVVDGDGERFALDQPVSMNLWGLRPSALDAIERRLAAFVDAGGPGELYLPGVVDEMVEAGEATATVLRTPDDWFGVTYADDAPRVRDRIGDLVAQGVYPATLTRPGR